MVHPTQPGLLDVEIQVSAKTRGIFSHNLYGVPQERSSIHTRGLSLPFHDSSINTQNTAPKSSVPTGDRGEGAIQFLKEVGNDGEILEEPDSPRPGTKQNHWFRSVDGQKEIHSEFLSSFQC